MSYVHDTNCMTTCFIGNVGEKNLANCGDSPNLPKFSPRQSFVLYGILANPIENESLEDITECADTESMAREIITPSSHKAAVWKYFGFRKTIRLETVEN